MKLWLDAQLSPALALWIRGEFEIEAVPIRDLGLRNAKDPEIYQAARQAESIVVTKDRDFVLLLDRLGPPPRVIWITCGNTSDARMRTVLTRTLRPALELLEGGEPLVEIGG